jgi:hypothetical protein
MEMGVPAVSGESAFTHRCPTIAYSVMSTQLVSPWIVLVILCSAEV